MSNRQTGTTNDAEQYDTMKSETEAAFQNPE